MMSHLMALISHSAVLTSLIVAGVIVLFVIETFSPHTYGLVGILATLMLIGLLYAYQIAGIGYWFGPWLMLAGIGLILLEIIGLHLHGLLMLVGAACIGVGIFYALGAGENAAMTVSTGVVVTFSSLFFALKLLPLSSFWVKSGSGNVLNPYAFQTLKFDTPCNGIDVEAVSDLRPRGVVLIAGVKTPARSASGHIRSGTLVKVTDVHKYEVIVTCIESDRG